MSKLYWGRALAQESFTGGWCHARVRPAWYWWLRRLRLFVLIVWRRYEISRLDARTAWDISRCAVGLVGPVSVYKPWWRKA